MYIKKSTICDARNITTVKDFINFFKNNSRYYDNDYITAFTNFLKNYNPKKRICNIKRIREIWIYEFLKKLKDPVLIRKYRNRLNNHRLLSLLTLTYKIKRIK